MVLLHGLGGSHLNWVRMAPLLAQRARVLAPDLPGFGYSPPVGRRTTVQANAAWVCRFLDEVVGGPAILVGNSMGGLISLLAAARDDERIAGMVLISPALPLAPREPRDMQVLLAFGAYFTPGIGELFVRRRSRVLGPEGTVRETFRLCTVDPSRIPEDVVEQHVALTRDRATMPWTDASVLTAARSLVRLVLRRPGFRSMLRRVRAPTLLINGEGDRLVKVAAARVAHEIRPDWDFVPLPDAGHIPMLEVPERTSEAITDWLDSSGADDRATRSPLRFERHADVEPAAERPAS
jgi:pimeloyl-ACP methyl ester carboxylesterase